MASLSDCCFWTTGRPGLSVEQGKLAGGLMGKRPGPEARAGLYQAHTWDHLSRELFSFLQKQGHTSRVTLPPGHVLWAAKDRQHQLVRSRGAG